MSYSIPPVTADTPADLHQALTDAVNVYQALETIEQRQEVDDHLKAIVASVDVVSSAFGDGHDAYVYTASVSGHANPDHAPKDGWSDDFITINVSAMKRPTEVPE